MSSVLSRRDKRLGRGVGNPLLDSESMPNRGRPELDLHRHARSKSCLCWRPRLFTAANTPWPPTVWYAPVIERPRQDRFRSTPEITQEISMPDEMTSRPRSPADMK